MSIQYHIHTGPVYIAEICEPGREVQSDCFTFQTNLLLTDSYLLLTDSYLLLTDSYLLLTGLDSCVSF